MEVLKQLIQQRGTIKQQVRKLATFFSNYDVSRTQAEVKLQKLDSLYRNFDEIQSKIEDIHSQQDDAETLLNKEDTEQRNPRDQQYNNIAKIAKAIIQQKHMDEKENNMSNEALKAQLEFFSD